MAKTAKQIARETQAAAEAADVVKARITKHGDGQVSAGEHVSGEGDVLYEAGEVVVLPRVVAEALEERGFAEIQDEPKPRRAKPEQEEAQE